MRPSDPPAPRPPPPLTTRGRGGGYDGCPMRLSEPAGPLPRVSTRAGFLAATLAALLLALLALPPLPLPPAARASTRHRATGPSALSSPARSATAAPAACEPLAGAAPEVLPVLRAGEGLNYAGLDLDRARDGTIEACVLADRDRKSGVLGKSGDLAGL